MLVETSLTNSVCHLGLKKVFLLSIFRNTILKNMLLWFYIFGYESQVILIIWMFVMMWLSLLLLLLIFSLLLVGILVLFANLFDWLHLCIWLLWVILGYLLMKFGILDVTLICHPNLVKFETYFGSCYLNLNIISSILLICISLIWCLIIGRPRRFSAVVYSLYINIYSSSDSTTIEDAKTFFSSNPK